MTFHPSDELSPPHFKTALLPSPYLAPAAWHASAWKPDLFPHSAPTTLLVKEGGEYPCMSPQDPQPLSCLKQSPKS